MLCIQILFLLNFHPLVSILWWILPVAVSAVIHWNTWRGGVGPWPLFTYQSHHSVWVHVYFSLWPTVHYYSSLFWCLHYSSFGCLEECFRLVPVPIWLLDLHHPFKKCFPHFLVLHTHVFPASAWHQPLLQGALVPLVGEWN